MNGSISLHIRGGRLIDPAHGVDACQDLFIAGGRVVGVGAAPQDFIAGDVIEAQDLVVCPGFVDLCARTGEPGAEHKATIARESHAALAAGVTTLCCPPDTSPIIDSPAMIELIHQRFDAARGTRVHCIGALTHALEGQVLSEMHALGEAGAVGVSNATAPIESTEVLRRAMEYAQTCGLTVFFHPEDPWLVRQGQMHEGAVSTRLGIAGIPATCETIALSRALLLVEMLGTRTHFCRLSAGPSVKLVEEARKSGLPVSADVGICYLHCTDNDVGSFNSLYNVRPPLRTLRDRDALRQGIGWDTIAAICSDHQPQDYDAKAAPFATASTGISSLEVWLPLLLLLVDDLFLTLSQALAAVTCAPAKILGLDRGQLGVGAPADLCLFDPSMQWTVDPHKLKSAGKNCPFNGQNMRGRVIYTIVGGELRFSLAEHERR